MIEQSSQAKRAALPWYPWNPSRFRDETLGWPLRAKGILRELYDLAWCLGCLPPGPQRLRELVQANAADWRDAWPRIEPLFPIGTDGQRRSAWIEETRARATKISAERATAGRRGGLSRARGKGVANA